MLHHYIVHTCCRYKVLPTCTYFDVRTVPHKFFRWIFFGFCSLYQMFRSRRKCILWALARQLPHTFVRQSVKYLLNARFVFTVKQTCSEQGHWTHPLDNLFSPRSKLFSRKFTWVCRSFILNSFCYCFDWQRKMILKCLSIF